VDVALSNTVVMRNSIGQFAADCQRAGHSTVERAVEDGAQFSREFAPVGSKTDPRTKHIKDSIHAEASGNSGRWWCDARHALAQEKGSTDHMQTGWANFFWENEGRDWEAGPNLIHHPGNPPSPYLRPAYEAVMAEIMDIAREEFPG
jgi:hypothetical protein